MKKPWYKSKTLIANLIAAIALFVQSEYGFVVDPQVQGYLLVVINSVLRLVTKEEVSL